MEWNITQLDMTTSIRGVARLTVMPRQTNLSSDQISKPVGGSYIYIHKKCFCAWHGWLAN